MQRQRHENRKTENQQGAMKPAWGRRKLGWWKVTGACVCLCVCVCGENIKAELKVYEGDKDGVFTGVCVCVTVREEWASNKDDF